MSPPRYNENQREDPELPEQDAARAENKRLSNIIWEMTQAAIALMITAAVIYSAVNKIDSEVLTNAFFLIVSIYFVKNREGGVNSRIPK